MSELLANPGIAAAMAALTSPVLLGIGFLVRRMLARKDALTAMIEAQNVKNREEAERLQEELMQAKLECMKDSTEIAYCRQALEQCQQELWGKQRDA